MCWIIDVEFENIRGHGEPPGRSLCEAHTPPESRQDDLGSLFLSNPGGMPRNGTVREDSRYDEAFSIEQHTTLLN
jgi:hypothetical protein